MAYEWRELPGREGYVDAELNRYYTRTFQVIVDSPTYGPGEVAALVPINMYASWSAGSDFDFRAILKKKSARMTGQQDGGYVWEVTCEYDSKPFDQKQGGASPSGNPGQSATEPTARPWQIEFGSNKTTKMLGPKDLDDKAVVASNGQPFDPLPEIPYARPTISITCFKAIGAESFGNVALYTNSINAGAWQGFAAKRVMCTEYKLQSQYEPGWGWFWQKSVSFEIYDEDLNPVKILDAGTYEKGSMSDNKPLPILDATGNPVSSPVSLNGGGGKLPNSATDLVYLDFTGYREVNWAGII